MKTCKDCGASKPLDDFYIQTHTLKSGERKKYRRTNCKKCENARYRAYHQANKQKMSQRMRAFALSRFGLTPAGYDAMLAAQGGGCAACGRKDECDGRALAVDHSHATGQVRGILCSDCNRGIGVFADSPARLRLAADYLERADATLAVA